jgi:polyhydroxybutyrate depolymerase
MHRGDLSTQPFRVIALSVVLLVASGAIGPAARAAQAATSSCAAANAATRSAAITVGGMRRSYLVHVPARARAQRVAVIFAFHGRGETPELLARYSGLSLLPAIVVYPRGLPGSGGKLSWSGTPTAARGIDDVGFVRALLAALERSSCIDRSRVYATGKSDGGGLAAQLACAAADRFAAVAPVAGAYYPIGGGCHPVRPVAVLEVHGTGDRVVPYGGSVKRRLPDVHDWVRAWADRDGCTGAAPVRAIARRVSRDAWYGCRARTAVVAYVIDGGGHTWPGARAKSGPGRTARDIDARTLIARFFADHPQTR